MDAITKKLSQTVDLIETLFKERFYEVHFNHISVDKSVAKTVHRKEGFYFEFAKMILTSQKDAEKLFNMDDEVIQFVDFHDKLSFKINQCTSFKFSVGMSGYTHVSGYIKDFTTNHLESFQKSNYRAVIITKEKFNVAQHFVDAKRLAVDQIVYGSGIIDLSINGIDLEFFGYSDKVTKRNYFIIETKGKSEYSKFRNLIDDIILGLTYWTGEFLGNNVLILGSATESFDHPELLSLKSFFDDLKDGYAAVPTIHFQREIGFTSDFANTLYLSSLIEKISEDLSYKRTILLICQAHSEPHYVKASLYSVALETITNLIYENIEATNKPIQDKALWKSLRNDLKNTLSTFKEKISQQAYSKFSNDLDRINSLTNKQKLLLPFEYYEFILPAKDIEAIEKRNDFLHGRIPESADKHNLAVTVARLLFCINFLVLKYISFKGCIFYHPVMYQHNNRLAVDEYPLRKI